MLNKNDIGKIITIRNDSFVKHEFYYVSNEYNVHSITGVYSIPRADLKRIDFEPIEVYNSGGVYPNDKSTGLFLDHKGERTFYIDTNRYLKEFLPLTKTGVNPTDYDNIRIVHGDIPLMMLSDHSMLITDDHQSIRRITATGRDNVKNFNIDGTQATYIYTLNFVGDRGTVNGTDEAYRGIQGVMEFDGIIPSNLISEPQRDFPDPDPDAVYELWNFNYSSGNIAIDLYYKSYASTTAYRYEIVASTYNNYSDNKDIIFRQHVDLWEPYRDVWRPNPYTCISYLKGRSPSYIGILKSIELDPIVFFGSAHSQLIIEHVGVVNEDFLYLTTGEYKKRLKIVVNGETDKDIYGMITLKETDKIKSTMRFSLWDDWDE